MTDGTAQRRFPRYTIVLPVLYTLDASESAVPEVGWTSNVSEGGGMPGAGRAARPVNDPQPRSADA